MKYYPAGHMMYILESSMKAFKTDVGTFIDRTSGEPAPTLRIAKPGA
jgi:hypothetical protein